MKTNLILLFSTVVYLVNGFPIENVSYSNNNMFLQRRFQDNPGTTGNPMTDPATSGNTQPAPSIIDNLIGKPGTQTSPIAPPPAGGDFIIQYDNNEDPRHFEFGECVSFKNTAGTPVKYAKFGQAVGCSIFEDGKCKSLQHPLPIPLPGGVYIINVAQLGSLLAGSYTCYPVDTFLKDGTNIGKIFGKGSPTDVTNIGKVGLTNPKNLL